MYVRMNLSEYVQMSADVHTSGKTDEDDRCECIRAWVCMGGGGRGGGGGEEEWGGSRVCMMEKRRIDMGAQ